MKKVIKQENQMNMIHLFFIYPQNKRKSTDVHEKQKQQRISERTARKVFHHKIRLNQVSPSLILLIHMIFLSL